VVPTPWNSYTPDVPPEPHRFENAQTARDPGFVKRIRSARGSTSIGSRMPVGRSVSAPVGRSVAALFFAALLVLTSCKKSDAIHRSTDLQVVSLGSEPRRVLRYKVDKGATQRFDVAIDVHVTAGEMGGPLPTIVLSMTVVAEDMQPMGAKLRATIVDAKALDRDDTRVPPNALAGPLEMMRGIELVATLTPNGRLFGTKIETGKKDVPEVAKAQLAALASSFDNLMMPLPDAAVGVGAVWRTSRPIEQNSMKLTAVNSIQLTAIDADRIAFDLDTEIHGDDQTISQAGMTVEIKDIVGTGAGSGTIDLRSLAVTNELTTELRSEMQATGEGSATPMRMKLETRVSPRTLNGAPATPADAGTDQGAQRAP
jgi:hypothetical protein